MFNSLVYDNIIHITSFLNTKNKIFFLSTSKYHNLLKDHIYYCDKVNMNDILHLWYFDQFTRICIVHLNDLFSKFRIRYTLDPRSNKDITKYISNTVNKLDI